jgi:hypothetical protein
MKSTFALTHSDTHSLALFIFQNRHSKICKKIFKQHRKPYDIAKHRAEGTELESFQSASRRRGVTSTTNRAKTQSASTGSGSGRQNSQNGNMPKWKAESLSFRQAIREARLVSVAEQKSKATGIPLHALLPPRSNSNNNNEVNSSFIPCPHCGRSFNEKAAERHIPKVSFLVLIQSIKASNLGVSTVSIHY